MKPEKLCGRCYGETDELFAAKCREKPELMVDVSLGMYHCRDCGAMLVAGLPHPELCALCRDRRHPDYDNIEPEAETWTQT